MKRWTGNDAPRFEAIRQVTHSADPVIAFDIGTTFALNSTQLDLAVGADKTRKRRNCLQALSERFRRLSHAALDLTQCKS